jgi:hypothetical protein
MAPAIKATGHVSVASLGLEGVAGLGYTAKAEIVAPVATSQAVGRLYEVERAKAATPARDISGVGDLRIASGHAVGEFEQALPDAVDLAWSELQRTTIDPNLDDDACMALGVFE